MARRLFSYRIKSLAHQVLVQAVTVRHPTVTHRLLRAVLPVVHVQLSSHVHDSSANASACFSTLNHGERLGHKGGSTHTFDVGRAP